MRGMLFVWIIIVVELPTRTEYIHINYWVIDSVVQQTHHINRIEENTEQRDIFINIETQELCSVEIYNNF